MRKIFKYFMLPACLLVFLLLVEMPLSAQASFDKYLSPEEIGARVGALARKHGDNMRVTTLATTPGGRKVWLLEIGSEINARKKSLPAPVVGSLCFPQILSC